MNFGLKNNRLLRTGMVFLLALLVAVSFCMPQLTFAAKAKKPSQVSGLKVTGTSYSTVSLKWKKAKHAKKYVVYSATSKNGKYRKVKKLKKTRYTVKHLTTNQTYWFKVRAVNGKKKGSTSAAVSAVPKLKRPTLNVKKLGEGNRLTLKKKISGASGYIYQRNETTIKEKKGSVCTDSSAAVDTEYSYRVAAYRNVGGKRIQSSWSKEVKATRPAVSIEQVTAPSGLLYQGVAFTIKGKITSYKSIQKVFVGVEAQNEEGKWERVTYKDETGADIATIWKEITDYDTNTKLNGGNAREFRILKLADEDIKFGKLETGKYRYRVRATLVDGTAKTLVNRDFEVIVPTVTGGAKKIAAKAKDLAYPYGTAVSTYRYKGGKPTAEYKSALAAAYPSRGSWGSKPKAGASCDVFVGTTIRATGYDRLFPRGLDEIEGHMKLYPNLWKKIKTRYEAKMIRGDVIYMIWNGGRTGHVCIYLGNGKVANAHYGSGGKYGVIEKFSSICRDRNYKKFYVYRPIK